jgi:hypothetical protein
VKEENSGIGQTSIVEHPTYNDDIQPGIAESEG